MADFIRIDLDSVKKFRNGQEWRWVNRAASGDFVSVGDGRNIVKVSKMLVDAGADPAKEVRVFRGDMLCMSGALNAVMSPLSAASFAPAAGIIDSEAPA